MLDKVERIESLVNRMAAHLMLKEDEAVFARRAAFISKADLMTKMVIEMTSLQGIMGREYALRSGEAEDVAEAIREQYLLVPKTKSGLAVALADRLDSLVGLLAVGLGPSGSKDPFALRRAAIGIVQPLIFHNINIDLRDVIDQAAELQPVKVSAESQDQVLAFIEGRLSVLLKETYRYDVVDAVLACQSANPAQATMAVKQLQAWVEVEDWDVILPAYSRCVRITRDQKNLYSVNDKWIKEDAEKQLLSALQGAEVLPRHPGSIDDVLNAFLPLIPSVNKFFDDVLVMAEEKPLRENRLGLVQRIANMTEGVADLSKLEGF
jgi:glycyl-tRNA synthetase